MYFSRIFLFYFVVTYPNRNFKLVFEYCNTVQIIQLYESFNGTSKNHYRVYLFFHFRKLSIIYYFVVHQESLVLYITAFLIVIVNQQSDAHVFHDNMLHQNYREDPHIPALMTLHQFTLNNQTNPIQISPTSYSMFEIEYTR